MGPEIRAVCDSGPIIHLTEIGCIEALKIAKSLLIPEEVLKEIRTKPSTIKAEKLQGKYKDIAKYLTTEYGIDLGEAEAISLCIQQKISLLFTDDLEARAVAKHYNIEVHGTVGILIKAFAEGIISKNKAIEKLNSIRTESSLFITKDLIDWSVKKIKGFKKTI